MMKARIAIALVGCCVFGGILTLAADDEDTSKPSELDALKAQVESLEVRIAVLENRLKIIPRDPEARILPPSLHGRPVPKSWSPRKFNGMTYYVIPLENDPSPATPVKK